MTLQLELPQAPRLQLRRPAHFLRLGSLVLVVIILAVFLVSDLSRLTWAAWVLINLPAWLWELVVTYRNRSTINIVERSSIYRRHYWRVILFFAVIVINLLALYELSRSQSARIDSIAMALVVYNLLAFAWLQYETFRWFVRGHNAELWGVLSFVAGGTAGFTIYKLHPDMPLLGVGLGVVTCLMNLIIFVMQRLSSEDRVRGHVIRSVILQILGSGHTREHWNAIVKQIHERLKYDYVTILEPTMDRSELVVVAEAGGSIKFIDRSWPAGEGITGHAFTAGETEAWNKVSDCSYYKQLTRPELDDTKAEIAIPIQYQGITFGILDVQSTHKNAFRWDDRQILEEIARILGVAISAQKTDLLIRDAAQLWEELSSRYYSEESIFLEFARFAQDKLGADIITYYSLTPTGYPARAPYYFGKPLEPDEIKSPIKLLDSPIIKMIHDWSPLFIDSIETDTPLGKWSKKYPGSFVNREHVRSLCFIPVGTAKERLGAMFLNYRKARHFDGLFKFMVLSFSQIFAILASRGRFKDVVFDGFGRPELGVHNLLGRYGFKTGVMEEGQRIFHHSCRLDGHTSFQECGMLELLHRMDEFLQAVSLANSSIPPMFWEESLKDELEKFTSTLPGGKTNRRPQTRVNIDARIEREAFWVKLALYCLITEAINNAVFHGEAEAIHVQARREHFDIIVRVVNDGLPLPQGAYMRQSRRGIFSLLTEFEKTFNARTIIEPGPDKSGTIVEVVLPAIPFKYEASHVENNSSG